MRVFHSLSISFWSGVRVTGSSPSAKNCERVMPKPLQSDSSVGIVGALLRLNIFDIVDWGTPEILESRYSVQFRSVRSSLILFSASICFTSEYILLYNMKVK